MVCPMKCIISPSITLMLTIFLLLYFDRVLPKESVDTMQQLLNTRWASHHWHTTNQHLIGKGVRHFLMRGTPKGYISCCAHIKCCFVLHTYVLDKSIRKINNHRLNHIMHHLIRGYSSYSPFVCLSHEKVATHLTPFKVVVCYMMGR